MNETDSSRLNGELSVLFEDMIELLIEACFTVDFCNYSPFVKKETIRLIESRGKFTDRPDVTIAKWRCCFSFCDGIQFIFRRVFPLRMWLFEL